MSLILPDGSPPRFLTSEQLPRGAELWTPESAARDGWTTENTDGIFACDIISSTLCLTKGRDRGKLIQLRHWQGSAVSDMLRLDADGERAYREYQFWVPRKNGKSIIGSGLAIWGMLDEPGGEVYAAAGSKEQARILFKGVSETVKANPALEQFFTVYRDVIECTTTGAIFRVLSAEAGLQEGLNPSLVLLDEVHVQPNSELYDVLSQGSGTREHPLVVTISTFGNKFDSKGAESFAYGLHGRAMKVVSGELEDDTLGVRCYETPADADHLDPETWYIANPGLGDFLSIADMASVSRKIHEAAFKTKRLNVWAAGKAAWLPAGAYDACADTERGPVPDGAKVVLSFDGSYSNDSTGIIITTVEETPHQVVLGLWERPDDDPHWRVPMPEVEAELLAAFTTYDVVELCADPYRWADVLQRLALTVGEERVIDFPQSPSRMIPATASFYERAVAEIPGVTHDGDPRLVRHIGNAVVKTGRNGGQLSKDADTRKIDLAVCAVMGLARAIHHYAEAVRLAALPPKRRARARGF